MNEMASVKMFGSIPLTDTCFDDPKRRKKKKAKKPKREKSDKHKSKPKGQQSLKDYSDICDSNFFTEWPEIKKKKRKKKHDGSLNEEFPLTQNKNLKMSKRNKQNRKSNRAAVKHGVRSGPAEQEAVQPIISSIQKEKKHKKRVVFNLSPVLLEPKPVQDPFVARDILQTQRSGAEKKPVFNAVFPGDGRHSKPTTEENVMESQSTPDDINSQDLFITQKTFSDPYIDLCSSASAEEALEPQGYSSAMKQLSPEPQSYTSPPPRKRSYPEPQKPLCPSNHPSLPRKPSHLHKLEAFTQTENFFTSPLLAASLRFRQQSTCSEEPMDLSLPKRSRLHQREAAGKASGDQRHPEPNVADLTQSDDGDAHLKSKADLSQLKVVQTRLNESFFFKLKGEGDSPKPMSPLMKLAGSVEKKKP
ncbi:hypothetical protein KOW79_007718 [Hemibagrus wyckioides]|uniref:Uncharacterized protein n=2 Tax=Hemibagrus wyckioides TaxID=337641 RepID=A0A9D3NVV5_9TELE|nr:hypothetical protein KOW79_007718 [Hemibagrus wyckioides]